MRLLFYLFSCSEPTPVVEVDIERPYVPENVTLPYKQRREQVFEAVLTADDAGRWTGATGSWYASFFADGLAGSADCAATFSFDAGDDASWCPECLFSFVGSATWDPSSAEFKTPNCDGLGVDGMLYFWFDAYQDVFVALAPGPRVFATSNYDYRYISTYSTRYYYDDLQHFQLELNTGSRYSFYQDEHSYYTDDLGQLHFTAVLSYYGYWFDIMGVW